MSIINKWKQNYQFELPEKSTHKPISSVLVLCNEANQSLVLTKRKQSLTHHPGEFCFPGGRMHQDDEDLLATALRETFEEIGIESNQIQSICCLPIEYTLNNMAILPIVASTSSITQAVINEGEVEYVIEVPISDALDLSRYQAIIVPYRQVSIKSLRFSDDEHFIWGATARIMQALAKKMAK